MLNSLVIIPLCRWYARRLERMGERASAERLLAAAHARGDTSLETRTALAERLLERLQFDAALAVLTSGEPPAGDDARHTIQLAWSHQGLGHREEALRLWQKVTVLKPSGEAFHQVGVLHHQAGRLHEAEDHYRKAMAQDPAHGESRVNLARILMSAGQLGPARELLQTARKLMPDQAAPACLFGETLAMEGRLEEALLEFDRAIVIDREFAAAHADRGLALHKLGRSAEALPSLVRAIELAPGNPNAWLTRGAALLQTGRVSDAIRVLEEALGRFPDHPAILSSLGACLAHTRDHARGSGLLDRALDLDPGNLDARFNRALQYLREGDYWRGFEYYEARLGKPEMQELVNGSPWSPWDGSPLEGKSILVRREQGFGDALQFARFFALLAAQGARVHVEADAVLKPLLERAPGVTACETAIDPSAPFDFWVPIMSLPGRLGVGRDSLPREVPYLKVDEQARSSWRDWLDGASPGKPRLRVGVVWASNPENWVAVVKSLELKQLLPVLEVPGVQFVSLQIGHGADQWAGLPPTVNALDATPRIRDFHDSACLMAELDLVISIDSAAAHLAGALGRPVWVLLHDTPDWRWEMTTDDSVWYPTARLFRQPAPGDWDTPIAAVRDALRAQAGSAGA